MYGVGLVSVSCLNMIRTLHQELRYELYAFRNLIIFLRKDHFKKEIKDERGWTFGVLGLISGGDWEFFSSPPRPERLWGPPSLLSNGYRRFFPWG
jgi:hypothetical protein